MKEFLIKFRQEVRQGFSAMGEKLKVFLKSTASFKPPAKEQIVDFVVHWWHWLLGGIFAFLVLYYPAGALLIHRIDVSFPATPLVSDQPESAGLQTVDALASLIDREVGKHVFTPALPFFFPSAVLDNMPAFQTGVIRAAEDVTGVMMALNPDSADLKQALEYLKYPADVWYVKNWKPASASQKKYQLARFDLLRYEKAVRKGKQTFNRSPSALLGMLSGITVAMKDIAAEMEDQANEGRNKIVDFDADDAFYFAKGKVFVYTAVLHALTADFPVLAQDSQAAALQQEALLSLKKALAVQPLFVVNASPETQFSPNHLLIFGFYVSRAQSTLTEMYYTLTLTQE